MNTSKHVNTFDPTTATCTPTPSRTKSGTKTLSKQEKDYLDVVNILKRPPVTTAGVWRSERDFPFEKLRIWMAVRFSNKCLKRSDDEDSDSCEQSD